MIAMIEPNSSQASSLVDGGCSSAILPDFLFLNWNWTASCRKSSRRDNRVSSLVRGRFGARTFGDPTDADAHRFSMNEKKLGCESGRELQARPEAVECA